MAICSETRQEFRWFGNAAESLDDFRYREQHGEVFVAELAKSFGGLGNAAESLDDFRYREQHGEVFRSGTRQEFRWLRRCGRKS